MKYLKLFAVLTISITATSAQADGGDFFRPAIMQMMASDESNGSTTSDTRTLVDGAVGYILPNGLTLGLLYGTEKQKIDYTLTSTENSRTSYGPSVGWTATGDTGFYFLATYFMASDLISGTTNYKGNGYQTDFGFRFPARRAHFGFQLSYKKFEYKRYSVSGASYDLTYSIIHTFLDPYFTAFFSF